MCQNFQVACIRYSRLPENPFTVRKLFRLRRLGNGHCGGAQYAVVQGIAFLHHVHDGVRLLLAFHGLEGLVAVRIELIAGLGQDFFNLSLLEGALEQPGFLPDDGGLGFAARPDGIC